MATVRAKYDFDAEAAAQQLKDAMKGLGTSEDEIIQVVADHSNGQRLEIKDMYKTMFGEDLVKDLKGELSGDFEQVCVALFDPPRLYDAKELYKAMAGSGTDETALIEILVTRSNEEMAEIKEIFKEEFGSDLEDKITGDTDGNFERLLVSLCNGNRDESDDVDWDMAQEDAQAMYEAGEAMWGTDESAFNKVLALRNFEQLRATFSAYKTLSEKTIEEAIDSECDGNLQAGYLAIVRFAQSPHWMYAKRIHDAMSGAGTDDDSLIRLIVTRCEKDMKYIKHSYQAQFEQSMDEAIESDCGGDYKRMLLKLIGELEED